MLSTYALGLSISLSPKPVSRLEFNMSKFYFLSIGLLYCSSVLAQRDFQLTQFIYDKLNVNPAYAGTNFTSNAFVAINSLSGGGGAELAGSQVARANVRLLSTGVGLGLSFESFSVGDFSSSEMSGTYAYHVRMGDEQYLSLGLEANYRFIESSVFASQFQPPINIGQGDFNFGALYYSQRIYAGVSAENLLGNPIEDPFGGVIPLSNGKRLFRGMLGSVFSISEKGELQPNLQTAYAEGEQLGYDVNLMYVWNRSFSIGFSYRYANFPEAVTRDNIDLIAQFKINDKLRIGTGLTFPQGKSSIQTTGGEVSATWEWSSEERPYTELPFF